MADSTKEKKKTSSKTKSSDPDKPKKISKKASADPDAPKKSSRDKTKPGEEAPSVLKPPVPGSRAESRTPATDGGASAEQARTIPEPDPLSEDAFAYLGPGYRSAGMWGRRSSYPSALAPGLVGEAVNGGGFVLGGGGDSAGNYSGSMETLDHLLEKLTQSNMDMRPMGELYEDVKDGHLRRQHAVQFALDVCVRKRQEALVGQLRKVEERISEVRQKKREVEMETVREVQQILDRLSVMEMQKLGALQLDADTLRRDIEEAHRFAKQTTSACERCTPDQLAQVYDSLLQSCRRLAEKPFKSEIDIEACLLYTSDAADEEDSVDLGGRRIIKKKKIT
eukprot:TRINITY_DN43141_c0_g1_i4.p1 TRINITY_DN43141_c0_g1~~TRINITY_DN43141_c0_g1_i4.p1  ORF type:complete len:337 (-),score=78.98 TRINITY_DN43141_c0_g1_i4:79-1089(-)